MNKLFLFGSPTCVPCQGVKARLQSEGIDFDYIDVWEKPEMAAEYMVMSTPTMIYKEEKAVGAGAVNELINKYKG